MFGGFYHVGDLGVEVDCWLGFYLHGGVLRIKSSTNNMWCDFTWTKKVSHITCHVGLYCALVWPHLEFSSTLWNSPFLTFNDLIKKVPRFVCVVYDRYIGADVFTTAVVFSWILGWKTCPIKDLRMTWTIRTKLCVVHLAVMCFCHYCVFVFCVAKIASVYIHPTKILGLFVQWHDCKTLTIHHFFSQWHIWHFYICDLLLYLTFSKYLKGMLKNWKAPSFSFCVTNALHVLSRRPLGCWQALK